MNDAKEFYHTDHLGSTRVVTSEAGTVMAEIQYKPFGEQVNTTQEKYTYNRAEKEGRKNPFSRRVWYGQHAMAALYTNKWLTPLGKLRERRPLR